jgi:2-dehydropantoate 2-reductase
MRYKSLNIAIFGVGAMGALFGSRLEALTNVTLFGTWNEQIRTLQREGLLIVHPDGRQSRQNLPVTDDLNEIPPANVALILVKSRQTARAARQATNILRTDGLVITLQNGLGNLEKLAETVGANRATLGVTAQGATVLAPGRLRHAGEGPTHLALLPDKEQQLKAVADLFNAAGLETTLVDNADSLVWGKLAINAGINPLTALLEVPNGALAEDKLLREVMIAAANEVVDVATAQGIRLPFIDVAGRIIEVCQATARNRSSMLQDISRGAMTEIDAISGAVVRFGQEFGVPTPMNAWLLQLVKEKEAGGVTFDRDMFEHLHRASVERRISTR